MRVAAKNVLPGDRVRGLGLVVEYSEPQSDYFTSLEGYVSQRGDDGEFVKVPVQPVVLPNDHRVNVVRSDENFHADRIRWTQEAIERFNDDQVVETLGGFIDALTRIANAPRHRYVDRDVVASYVHDSYEGGESTSAEQLVGDLDAIEAAEPSFVIAGDDEEPSYTVS